MKTPTKEEMLGQLQSSLKSCWLQRIFDINKDPDYFVIYPLIPMLFDEIMQDQGSRFRKVADKIIFFVLTHDIAQLSGPENPNKQRG